jgi:SAM-dependent methyltransferase
MAIPLTQYLNAGGRYEGFDVAERAIAHCRNQITPRYPNFHFTHADLANGFYNPAGGSSAAGYSFPYPDASFDLAFATSVFTHLLPEPSERYMMETTRVLRPGGRFMATFFLMDGEARRHMEAGESSLSFLHPHGFGCWVGVLDKPEAVVSYSEPFVRDLYARAGLRINEPIGWGNWSGRSVTGTGYQDQIVAVKV